MAKAFQRGKGWCVRQRFAGKTYTVSGHPTPAMAERAMRQLIGSAQQGPAPESVRQGPDKVKLADALRAYGHERLQSLSCTPQEKRLINRYLQSASLPPLGERSYFAHFDLAPRLIPVGPELESWGLRRALVSLLVASVRRAHVQNFLSALCREGASPAALARERACLRAFFDYVRECWAWAYPVVNPATRLVLPRVERVRPPVHEPSTWKVAGWTELDFLVTLKRVYLKGVEDGKRESIAAPVVAEEVTHG